ncbi:MAG: alpha/beta hydrolase [Luteimonas sp.]|nr:alpha/beta hydrolase [Luteimonas sp.]
MSITWAKVRKVWAITGTIVLVATVGWALLAFRANDTARDALHGDERVSVEAADGVWHFEPAVATPGAASLLFFPGGMVDPVAYAPLLRDVAAHGHRAMLVALPRRGAFGGAEDPALLAHARALTTDAGSRWVVAGHSKGGKVAALFAHAHPEHTAALVLIGTSHPRDVDLSDAAFPVVQVLGDRDPIASIERANRNRRNLPADASRIVVEGGNHSRFGEYGFQPGDRFAAVSRERQREATLSALLSALASVQPASNDPAMHTTMEPSP